jgi:hypothetical protein
MYTRKNHQRLTDRGRIPKEISNKGRNPKERVIVFLRMPKRERRIEA